MAGRDIGTVVLPDADLKLFLDASVEERARRRTEERELDPDSQEAAVILAQLRRRDELDRNRAVAPLRAADDAIHIVTDGNTFEQTVDAVVAAIRAAERARRDRDARRRPSRARTTPTATPDARPRKPAIDEAELFRDDLTPLISAARSARGRSPAASPGSRSRATRRDPARGAGHPREQPHLERRPGDHRRVAHARSSAGGSTGSARRRCSSGRSSAGWPATAASSRSIAAPPTSRRSGSPSGSSTRATC